MTRKNKLVRLGLVGLGKQGQEHFDASKNCKKARIVACCDTSEDKRELFKTSFPDIPCYGDLEDLLRVGELDGLVLALPHHVYSECLDKIKNWGKPVLKEKPLARNLSEAFAFLEPAGGKGGNLRTGIQRRKHPTYARLKEEICHKDIRALELVLHLGFDPLKEPLDWRGDQKKVGGGALLDSGYHMIDLAIFLIGSFEVVSANLWLGDKPAGSKMIETDATIIGRSGKTWVRIESKVGGKEKKEVVRVATPNEIYRADRESLSVDQNEIFCCSNTWKQAMATQIDAFAEDILEKKLDQPEVWEQLAVMRIIENAYAFARQVGAFEGGYKCG